MFAVYEKNIDGRIYERYYKEWKNAEKQLQDDLKYLLSKGCKISSSKSSFNKEKGRYDFYYTLVSGSGRKSTLMIADGFFQD